MKKSELNKQWQKELARVQRLINKAKKQGVEFEFDPIPKEPKRITESSVQRLKKIDIDKIKKAGKITEPEPLKLKQKSAGEIKEHKPRRIGVEKIEPKKRRRPPNLTDEQRSARAKKAAETRKSKLTPEEIAERERRKQEAYRHRLDTLKETRRLAREAREQRLANDPEAQAELHRKRSEAAKKAAETRKQRETPEQRSARAKKAAETRAKNKAEKEQQITPQKEPISAPPPPPPTTDAPEITPNEGVDPLTGELIDVKEQEKQASKKPKQKRYSESEYHKLIARRDELRPSLTEIDDYTEEVNIIETLKEELYYAVNEDIADLLLDELNQVIEDKNDESPQAYQAWLNSVKNAAPELLDNVYGIVDESDGEKVKNKAVSFLMVIHGGYGQIPQGTLEQVEQLANEFSYYAVKDTRYQKQRKILRAKKIRSRLQ